MACALILAGLASTQAAADAVAARTAALRVAMAQTQSPATAPRGVFAPSRSRGHRATARPAPERRAQAQGERTTQGEGQTQAEGTAQGEGQAEGPSRGQGAPNGAGPEIRRPTVSPHDETTPPAPQRPGAVPMRLREPGGVTEGFARIPEIALRPGGFEVPDLAASNDFQADDIYTTVDDVTVLEGNVKLWLDDTTFSMDRLLIEEGELEDILHAQGNVVVTQENSVLEADDLLFRLPRRVPGAEDDLPETQALFEAEGMPAATQVRRGSFEGINVTLTEPDRLLIAEFLAYDFETETGEAINARGQADIFYFGAEHIMLIGAEDMAAENAWITTCDCDHDYYKLHFEHLVLSAGEMLEGERIRFEIAGTRFPFAFPRWSWQAGQTRLSSMDFKSGRNAGTGYYINFSQRFYATPDIELGYRLYPTEKEGVGVGLEGAYDFMSTPTSPLFRGQGDFRTMYTTEGRGHLDIFHRQELLDNTVLMMHWEQWSDADFIKDFYYNEMYRNRTEPRAVANVTVTEPAYIATATVRPSTHGFVTETERLPEFTFHFLERPVHDNLYVSFDAVAGYNERDPGGDTGLRSVNRARLSFDPNLSEAFSIVPFAEIDASWYSETRGGSEGSSGRLSGLLGVTASTRFHRTYGGALGFSAFKHIVLPSLTLSYRPTSTLDFEDTPRFDALDDVRERTRIESSVTNIVLGRDAESGEVWPVGRLSLYHGHDLSNELRTTSDYQLEMDVRPRPWWGVQVVAQRHKESDRIDFGGPFVREQTGIRFYERVLQPFLGPLDEEVLARYGASRGDFDRILGMVYYNNTNQDAPWNGRVGYAYTKTRDEIYNREVLFGLGYRISEAWSVAFEHRYDFEQSSLVRQRYELRRDLDCVAWTLRVEDRRSGFDINFGVSITAFPGSGIRF